MSKRSKKRKGFQSSTQLLKRAERELGKGKVKTALKDSKVAYRIDPTPAARKLLEVAFAGRVEQLQRQNLLSEAQVVLRDLLELKPIDPGVCDRLPRLQVLVGDKDADPAALFEQQPELLIELTDRAVLDWKSLPPEHASIPPQVIAVREALSAIEAGDDQRAAELLQEIPRTSPLSDWKFFARGLSAFYQRDNDRLTANWRRLDLNRPASRIARTLQAAAGISGKEDTRDVSSGVKRLESRLGSDGYEQLVAIGKSWQSGNWRHVFGDLRRFRQRHGKSNATTMQQIAELAWRRAVREDDDESFRRLIACLPALELDPKWNRARALMAECSRYGDATEVEDAWKAYGRDVRELTGLRDDERSVAEALVYLRLGRKFIEFAESNASHPRHSWDGQQDDGEDLRKPAVRFLRHSMQVCPQLTEAYRELAKLHEAFEDVDKAASVYEKLLKQVPDEFDAQVWLARFYLERDEPSKAEAYTVAVRRLKPRDPQCVALEWTQQLTTVRCLIKKRKLDEARTELKKLREVRPPDVELFGLDLIAAAIEFKAKNSEAAHKLVDDAAARLEEPTAAWLQMSYIAARYSLPRDIKKVFDQRYKDDIEKTPTSQTAGLLAKFFASLKCNQVNYTGRATQERLAIAYLKRAEDVPWSECDVCHVCNFLGQLPRQGELLEELADAGLELFPNSPQLLFRVGEVELRRGPCNCDVQYALHCFRSAIELNEQAALPMSAAQLGWARESLSRLEDFTARSRGLGIYDEDEDEDFADEDSSASGMSYFGTIDGLPPGVSLEQVINTMPPDLREEMEDAASMAGMTLEQVIMAMLSRFGTRTAAKQPGGRSRTPAPQSNQARFEFADD